MKNEKELLKSYNNTLKDLDVYTRSMANMSNILLHYFKIYFEKNMNYCEFKIKETVTDEKTKAKLLKVIRESRENVNKFPKKLSKDQIREISNDVINSIARQVPELLEMLSYENELCEMDKDGKFNIKKIIRKLH